ncbi:hypothetical protein [Mariniflexile ostreae]|uniref:hypothetical protein n=1 Tax=Mariniflexile ostreae TaxID=1520892 RepID=UPI0036D247A3
MNNSIKAKDKQILLNHIVQTIEQKTGLSLLQLKRKHPQHDLYKIGLFYFTTTNKTICEALKIPVEAGTRRKRKLEKDGRLMSSIKKGICPFTGHKARFLSTNPDQYNKLLE